MSDDFTKLAGPIPRGGGTGLKSPPNVGSGGTPPSTFNVSPRVKGAEMLSDRRLRFLEAENARLRATYAELTAANNRLSALNNSLRDVVTGYEELYHDDQSVVLKT